jgi:predicted glycogen debranching enzyme
MVVRLGRSITSDKNFAFQHEWLVTNGLGGYASGSLSGARTRRYHSLLTVASQALFQRFLLVAAIDIWVQIGDRHVPLTTHDWAAGIVLPDGYRNLERFTLDGTIPVFHWTVGEVCIEQRIWMAHGKNTTYVTWHYQRGTTPIKLHLKPLITYRSHHDITVGGKSVSVTTMSRPWKGGLGIDILPSQYLGHEKSQDLPTPFQILTNKGVLETGGDWWWAFRLAKEAERGNTTQEDLYQVGTINIDLQPNETIAMVCTQEAVLPETWDVAYQKEQERQADLLKAAPLENAPRWIQHLVKTADQFVVEVEHHTESKRHIISGYPWFGIWGRTALASSIGLTCITGRYDVMKAIVRNLVGDVDHGLLPNRVIDDEGGETHTSIDASLWLFIALWHYFEHQPNDEDFLKEFYPTLVDILDWYAKGTTLFEIGEDTEDSLLVGGNSHTQVTWMDATAEGKSVTSRSGKAVEVNALWYNAHRTIEVFAKRLDKKADAKRFKTKAEKIAKCFNEQFWYETGGYLYDVIDATHAKTQHDSTLRPNQLFALSLPFRLLDDDERAKKVVNICGRELLTSYGLRTLSPEDKNYIGQFSGPQHNRDKAYHQGTVWGWLIGAFVSAHLAVYQDPETAQSFLEPFADHLYEHGLGTISQIFDGNPPFRPNGAFAQALSVAEILRAWYQIEHFKASSS